ncbi:serine/threonine-protein kinase [Actinoplanes flavus]|uniref:non-specific serine/threonine protein kinase n=1 Tax=Actinoplanes flavus TaxID=2820290 RepID=A0ABS3UQR9_9ACTN|nr:serine/threonine-protein kinase [Actinoplanes flavus]MBO3741130.1 serine/threonine protein kinase [Actinoplanes flavus]
MTGLRQIGGYRIERLLGAGSFATVWLGHDPALDAHVAIKVLADNWAHDLRVRERFQQEARLLWRLADDRVVRVYAVGELPDGRPYSVMEFAEGGSLRDRLDQGDLPPTVALRILREIAAGVAVLHRHRIVHRDLTPGNILFQTAPPGPDRVLIADLGLAKALAAASGLTARAGTPGYMAPEQDDPLAAVGTSADVYGLGRLGARLLSAPRSGGRPRLRPGVPAGVATLLHRATARDPRDRPPDAAAFAAALDRAVGNGSGGAFTRFGRATAVIGAVVVLAGVPSDAALPEGAHTARDGTGRLTVVLPAGWRAAGSGWAGRPDGDGRLEPALVISPDPGRWRTDPGVPGAFVGLSRSAGKRTTAAGFVAEHPHARCAAAPVRHTRRPGAEWVVARFTCGGPKPVIIEAARPDARTAALLYVQLAPVPETSDQEVDALLAGVGTG